MTNMTNLPERRLLPERAIGSFDEYVAAAGGQALAKALTIRRERIIADIKRSGLRGRGGGGFSTGVKWPAWLTIPALSNTLSAMAPRVSRAHSKTGTSCERTPTSFWRVSR